MPDHAAAAAALTENPYQETKVEDDEGETSFNNNNNSKEESREALPALQTPRFRRNRSVSLGSSTFTDGTIEGATNSKSGRQSGRVIVKSGHRFKLSVVTPLQMVPSFVSRWRRWRCFYFARNLSCLFVFVHLCNWFCFPSSLQSSFASFLD